KADTPASSPSSAPGLLPASIQSAQTPPSSSVPPNGEKFVAETLPFIGDRARLALANEYVPAPDHKAFAVTPTGVTGFVVGQPSEEAAKTAALEQCQKRADNVQPQRRCEIYAVGNYAV